MNQPHDMQDMAEPERRGGHDEADTELEALLRAMPLRRPSPELDGGVLRELRRARQPHGPRSLPPRRWAAAAVAASIVLAFCLTVHFLSPGHPHDARQPGIGERTGPGNQPVHRDLPALATASPLQVAASTAGTAAPAAPQPVRLIRTLGGVADDGVVGTVNGIPVRRLRRATVEQVFVFEPGRGTYVTYRRPTEQVVLVATPAF